MKIGKFAKVNQITIDAIRHYMDLGLIMPEKSGGQYEFDAGCQKDLEEILSLKEMSFSLNEIKSIFMIKRLANLTQYQKEEGFRAFFDNRERMLENQIQELDGMKKRLETKMMELSKPENVSNRVIGVDINALKLLTCLKCGKDLELREGSITNNQIMNGKLGCTCGEEYTIEDGILNVASAEVMNHFQPEENFIMDYIRDTDRNYLENIYQSIDWITKKMDFSSLKNKIIMELGSGAGFSLRSIYQNIPDDAVYIAVDHDINRHRFLKNILQKVNCKKNILFLCSDFLKIPVRDKSVDLILDFTGTTNYSFEHEEFLLKLVDHYIKDNADLMGSYIMFKNFLPKSQVEDKFRKNFIQKHIKEQITKLNFNILEEKTSDYMEKGGKYEDYFNDGEKVYSYLIIGKR
jgi:DNA-binding transcriptional MerR regulator